MLYILISLYILAKNDLSKIELL